MVAELLSPGSGIISMMKVCNWGKNQWKNFQQKPIPTVRALLAAAKEKPAADAAVIDP